jgi:membrane protein implicated in regulation of membrane protease activity
MEWVADLYINYPLLIWLGVAAIFLAIEVSTGSGWLLWPAGAAAIVALLTFLLPDNLMVELAIFAVLTGVTALFGRRFLPKTLGGGPDINDNLGRLVGKQGRMVGPDRVFIDGKEWAAVSDGADPLPEQRVEVVAAEGAVLRVRAA